MPAMAKGLLKNSVVLSCKEFHVMAVRMGYTSDQNLRDDLAMGLIPPTPIPVTHPTALLEVEGSGNLVEVSRHRSEPNLTKENPNQNQNQEVTKPNSQRRLSWADEAEVEEAQQIGKTKSIEDGETSTRSNQETIKAAAEPRTKTWAGVVIYDGRGFSTDLEFIKPGMTVEFSKEQWDEGSNIWKHVVIGVVVSFRPSFPDVQRWIEVNWKSYKPKIYHVRPGIYLFEFRSENDKKEVLSKSWSFYQKSQFSLKAWDVNMDVDNLDFKSAPVWIQLPHLKLRLWSSKAISKLASFVGVPIAMDRLTTRRD